MILLSNVRFEIDNDFKNLKSHAAKLLKTDKENIISVRLKRKSLDSRKKQDIHFVCSLIVAVKSGESGIIKRIKNASAYKENIYVYKTCPKPALRPVVVGFGPAGMFAALTLARAGFMPIVIERGADVDTRIKDVDSFFAGGSLNPESNIQFGEGGAGTFSDGKLNTGIKDIRCDTVLNELHKFGADEKILYDAKPHVGTDILVNVVKNLREEIISLGGSIHFNTKLCDIISDNLGIVGITATENGKKRKIKCEKLILALGHSARDTFKMLQQKGITLVRKPFSMGVRIEHDQTVINKAQYGQMWQNEHLPPADYKLAVHLKNGRGVYTFCMCPGGMVVNAASEKNTYVTNGMSYSGRNGKNANSALLVGINESDLPGDDPLYGMQLQRDCEKAAFNKTGGRGVPVQLVGDFLNGVKSYKPGSVTPTVKPNFVPCSIDGIYPDFITEALREALPLFAKKLHGFDMSDAVLTAPETRSSCPVRIVRDNTTLCSSLKGLYPAGEGAGYAGGIMSAAVDGMKVAEAVIESLNY